MRVSYGDLHGYKQSIESSTRQPGSRGSWPPGIIVSPRRSPSGPGPSRPAVLVGPSYLEKDTWSRGGARGTKRRVPRAHT